MGLELILVILTHHNQRCRVGRLQREDKIHEYERIRATGTNVSSSIEDYPYDY